MPLTDENWDLISGTLKLGHSLSVRVYGSQTEIGSSSNLLEARVHNSFGTDVTDQYDLKLQAGILVVIEG